MIETSEILEQMNDRSREVFRLVVENYLESGVPVGSRTVTRNLSEQVSAATVRNVMQDLEYLGLLDSPHVSAGRIPTQNGLRIFVDGLLEVDNLSEDDREKIHATVDCGESDVASILDRVGNALSGLTRGASLVLAPKTESPITHVEFLSLAPDRALVVLVFSDGRVENRLFSPPAGLTPSAMREAANFVNAFGAGLTLAEFGARMKKEISRRRSEIDDLAQDLVESGIVIWEKESGKPERLIVRGRSHLLDDSLADLDRIRGLFDELERKRDIAEFLELSEEGEGVRIFIGSENKLFSLSGSSLVVSPYMDADRRIVGAVGIIGPTRLNYGRVVPVVNYTAQLVGKILSDRS